MSDNATQTPTGQTAPPAQPASSPIVEAGKDAVGKVAETGKKGIESLRDAFSGMWESIKSDGLVDGLFGKGKDHGKKFMDAIAGMNWKMILGGLGGLAGAWLLSSLFGGGLVGMIAFGLLAIPGFLMGIDLMSDRPGGAQAAPPAADKAPQRANEPGQKQEKGAGMYAQETGMGAAHQQAQVDAVEAMILAKIGKGQAHPPAESPHSGLPPAGRPTQQLAAAPGQGLY